MAVTDHALIVIKSESCRRISRVDKIHQDMVGAMKQRAAERLSTLRMVKAALKNKEIDQRSPVTDEQALEGIDYLD